MFPKVECGGIEVYFNVHKKNIQTKEEWESGWFHNLILDSGLDTLTNYYFGGTYGRLSVGTDSTEPSVGQTGLGSFVAESSDYNDLVKQSDNPLYYEQEGSPTFSAGTFAGENLAELGLSEEGNGTNCLNRQLISQQISVSGETFGTGDGSIKQFTGVADGTPIEPDSIEIISKDGSNNDLVVTDDGDGNLTGDVDSGGNNNVDLVNGDIEVTFSSAPADGELIYISYIWWEPTAVTVTDADQLTIYFKIRIYPWFGKAYDYSHNTTFQFTDKVRGRFEGGKITSGDGSTKQFIFTLNRSPVTPGTFSCLSYDGSELVVTDDGDGNLTGDVDSGGNNTINYDTGEIDVTFSSAPADNNSDIPFDNYIYVVYGIKEQIGTGDGSTKHYTYTAEKTSIESNSVKITSGLLVVTDDGDGNLTGDVDSGGNNTINYDTGEIDVTFSSAPADNDLILLNYNAPHTLNCTAYLNNAVIPSPPASFGEFGGYTNATVYGLNYYGKSESVVAGISYTKTANGGPYYNYSLVFSSGEGGMYFFRIDLSLDKFIGTLNFYLEFPILKRDQDKAEFSVKFGWGRYYGAS